MERNIDWLPLPGLQLGTWLETPICRTNAQTTEPHQSGLEKLFSLDTTDYKKQSFHKSDLNPVGISFEVVLSSIQYQ